MSQSTSSAQSGTTETMDTTTGTTLKRNIIENAWDKNEITSAKRPKIELDSELKVKCLKALIYGYGKLLELLFENKEERNEMFQNVSVSHQITSIIFTIHNVKRQQLRLKTSNMINKNSITEFKITVGEKQHILSRDKATTAWVEICNGQGLVYKDFKEEDENNWIGTIGPYLNFFGSFGLRLNELRIGHSIMPKTRADGYTRGFPVSQYGISGAHHVLLEGSTYPPERRSSMAQSMGPLTALLCMIRSEGIYRKKWESAVKRAMSHISCIDDIITATQNTTAPNELATMISILADILLVTTSRQAQRMAFPLNMLSASYTDAVANNKGEEYLEGFNVSGRGAFITYKAAQTKIWSISGSYTKEKASQIVFHCIMGTGKEDFGVLSSITDVNGWFTREEIGSCFKKTEKTPVKFKLPKLNYYAKLSSANQTGMLAGVFNQVTSVPVFSGKREITYTDDFFEHLNRKTFSQGTGKTIPQIVSTLTDILSELMKEMEKNGRTRIIGTTTWREMESISVESHGRELPDFTVKTTGRFYMGKSNRK